MTGTAFLPLNIAASDYTSVPEVLATVMNGLLEPEVDINDDPLWSKAMASPKREYWIAGAQDEIRSLEELKVFVLVPRSDVPASQQALRGKLVCKHKHDNAGKVLCYKVQYIAKGFV